ncbi:prepilin-type N-terminal cleavage/methylation domain-containing protein [Paenibacillus shirakamiensis]|uniref:Prepilin-type N-terminal cleavage/methylation domain-containing protein n=1 Tax=Paenibacillus shirakamiensis TaxID=1265935 RepID=A0ABS4JKG8_9BACL|nr:prepilin-type N-terminal cleavage/methylation domain-containing protein [Paenibacillus shirakamiensis]MBP2001571.1 prepilin-type N-terminal cleavage/methylation domain-containing protein [Paenibacillus shirakamiensis]
MSGFVKRRMKEEGFTLIELIAVLSLFGLVLGLIYSVLMFGFKSYTQIHVENALRDEADIVMSSVITELYTFGPDRISSPGKDSQTLILEKEVQGSGLATEVKKREIKLQHGAVYIRDLASTSGSLGSGAGFNDPIEVGKVSIASTLIERDPSQSGIHGSSLLLDSCESALPCSRRSGLLTIQLVLQQESGGKPYQLEVKSKFGF